MKVTKMVDAKPEPHLPRAKTVVTSTKSKPYVNEFFPNGRFDEEWPDHIPVYLIGEETPSLARKWRLHRIAHLSLVK